MLRLEDQRITTSINRIVEQVVENNVETVRRKSVSSSQKSISRTASEDSLFSGDDLDSVKTQYGAAASCFYASLTAIDSEECHHCNEKFPDKKLTKGHCDRCRKDKMHPKKFSPENNMDPLAVPAELQGLTHIEELLIAQVRPIMSVYRLPYGQLGYSGNIINFPCDVSSFATTLSPKVSDVDIILVRKKDAAGCFKVRRGRVRDALVWLKNNNQYYTDIEISEQCLSQLPLDDLLSSKDFVTVEEEASEVVAEQSLQASEVAQGQQLEAESSCENDDATYLDPLSTFVPMSVNTKTQKKYAVAELEKTCSSKPLSFPEIDKQNPINEFQTEGYVARAFPTLLPYGFADLKGKRDRTVTPLEYFRHMMRYHDQRFARHARFRYFALNSILRWRALSVGQAYIKQHPNEKNISLQELRDMSSKDKEVLAKAIMRIGYTLPGTRAFWQSRKKELLAFISQLGTLPSLFFTLSAADFHWPELHELMKEYSSKAAAVSENPLLCVWFFHHKVNLILKTILPQLGLVDYWGRFEFQHRGSIHFHGLCWLEGCPDVSKLDDGAEEDVDAIIKYFDNIVTSWNPVLDDTECLESHRIPCNPTKVPLSKVVNVESDYKDLVMTCQRHTRCTTDSCLRRKGNVVSCRFNFPKKEECVSRIEIETDDTNEVEHKFIPRRNDVRLNVHNKFLLQVHRANIDVKPIVSKRRVVAYLTKYVSKGEVSSKGLKATCESLLKTLSPLHSTMKLAQRLLMRTVGERDYSALETVNILMEMPLVLQSRQIIHLSLRGDRRLAADEEADTIAAPSEVDCYFKRPPEMNNISLLEYVKRYYRNAKGVVCRKKDAVVVVHPNLFEDADSPLYEDFCKFYLLQHKPSRMMSQLKGKHGSYEDAFKAFIDVMPKHDNAMNLDMPRRTSAAEEVQNRGEDDEYAESADADADPHVQDDWMLICSDATWKRLEANSHEKDWCESYRLNPRYVEAVEFYDKRLTQPLPDTACISFSEDRLNSMQRKIFDYIMGHKANRRLVNTPLRMVVSGTAGTGKPI